MFLNPYRGLGVPYSSSARAQHRIPLPTLQTFFFFFFMFFFVFPFPLVATSHFGFRVAFVVSSLENLCSTGGAGCEEQAAFEIAEAATLWISESRFVLLSFQNFLFFPRLCRQAITSKRSIHFLLVRGLSSSLFFSGSFELLLGVFGIREEEEEEEEEGQQEEEEEADCFENCGKCYDVLELCFLLFCLLMISMLSQLSLSLRRGASLFLERNLCSISFLLVVYLFGLSC
jgi:hypothetical protein